ncbi:hypothetical protein [Lactococcus garvieae]
MKYFCSWSCFTIYSTYRL